MKTLDELFLRSMDHVPEFSILQAGMASPERISKEPYHDVMDRFRGSRILVCDPDEQLCECANQNRQPYDPECFPVALGPHGRSTPFYITKDTAWNSTYKPNEDVLRRYQNMADAMPEAVAETTMVGIDQFLKEQDTVDIDFVRIHLPWSGIKLLQSGEAALKSTLAISINLSMLPLYEDQEIFGNVCQYLAEKDFVFHKFIGLYGRTFNPVILKKDPNYISHHLWCHAIFLKDIMLIKKMNDAQLQKFALIADMYGSKDVAMIALMAYDVKHGTQYGKIYGELEEH